MATIFSAALRTEREARATHEAARQRREQIERDTASTDARLHDLVDRFRDAAGQAALAGKTPDAKKVESSRAKIVAERDRLRGLEAARPLAVEVAREAAAALEVARRDLSSAAIPELHRRRLEAVGRLRPHLDAIIGQLAAIAAVDKVQDYFCGPEPFVSSLPDKFYFGEPLVANLVAAIAPQFLDDPFLAKKMNGKAKELARAEIERMEKDDG